MTSPYLTKAEAAEYARCTTRTIDRAILRGDLQAGGTPGKVLVKPEWIDEWLVHRENGNRSKD